jgi:acetoin utilization protein AcuB
MTRDVVTITTTETVQDAVDLMWAAGIRHIPVVKEGMLVGIISDRDLRSYMLPHPQRILHADEARARMAAEVCVVMRADSIAVTPETRMADIIDIFLEEKIGAVPVLHAESGALQGMVSYIDVLRAVRELF